MTTLWTLGCDALDPVRLARFWANALGYIEEPGYEFEDGASIIDPRGVGPAIGFLKVPEGKSAKNRMHIDIRTAEGIDDQTQREQRIRVKSAELVADGAQAIREDSENEVLDHIVMADPEGNEFCVA